MSMPINEEWTGPQSQEQPWNVGDAVRINMPGNILHGSYGEVTSIGFSGRQQFVEVLGANNAWRMNFFPGDLVASDVVLAHEDPTDPANHEVAEVPALDPNFLWPKHPDEQVPRVVDLPDTVRPRNV